MVPGPCDTTPEQTKTVILPIRFSNPRGSFMGRGGAGGGGVKCGQRRQSTCREGAGIAARCSIRGTSAGSLAPLLPVAGGCFVLWFARSSLFNALPGSFPDTPPSASEGLLSQPLAEQLRPSWASFLVRCWMTWKGESGLGGAGWSPDHPLHFIHPLFTCYFSRAGKS